jgi:hypothetical protein
VKKERKIGLGVQTIMTMATQKKRQNKTNKAQSEKNNNQPDRNGGDLPSAGGRQPLNTTTEPPRKRVKKEIKIWLGAQTIMTMATQKKKQNKTNKAQSEKNNNQPANNGGDLPTAGGRQPLNTATEPPILTTLIFEEAEVVKIREVSFGVRIDARD